MNRRIPRLPSPGLVIAVAALVLSLGGTAVAARHYLVTNTKQISPKALRQLTDIAAHKAAAQATGAPGAPGAAGSQGPPGPSVVGPAGEKGVEGDPWHGGGWAVVDGEGENVGVTSSNDSNIEMERVGEEEGTYAVSFGRDVSECAYEATIGLSESENSAFPGFITVVGRSGLPNSVLVQTFNTNGDLADRSFHLAVFC
jgi:hypothetical protein